MDAIFGWKNFRNEIVWCYAGGGIPKRDFPRKHDIILRFAKTRDFLYRPVYRPYSSGTLQRGRTPIKGKYFERGLNPKGTPVNDWWPDVKRITSPTDPEKTGYPTQKSLELYERVIEASSNKGDFVLDPFCGCATTPIAAERLKRQWVGMDIWDKAHETVLSRLAEEGMLTAEQKPLQFWTKHVHYETEPPRRSDDNELAAPSLKLKTPRAVEPWEKLTHRQMVKVLEVAQRSNGNVICAGCGRELEREFMELDHITPRVDGGENHIRNRILLCRPCNGRKGQYLTLRGLLRENKKVNWMKDEGLAQLAREHARERADWVWDNFESEECQALVGV